MKGHLIIGLMALMLLTVSSSAQQLQQPIRPDKQPERVKVKVPDFATAKLNELGFVAVPHTYQEELAWLYRSYKEQHWPAIVTSDAILHTSHLILDWYQRFLEIAYLRDDLINLTDALLSKMMEYYDELHDPEQKEAALRNAAFFTVAKRLLVGGDTKGIPEPWKTKIENELALINDAEGIEASPLFTYKEDYSQYKPRGHYARSEQFEQYFRAMMWYGRMAFRLHMQDSAIAETQTLQAMLICRALDEARIKGETARVVWKRIYETTALFAGHSDDLTPEDYLALRDRLYDPLAGHAFPGSKESITRFMEEARKLRKPRILSTQELAESVGGPDWKESTAGMRLFGTRYALDSEIMQRLTFDSVKGYTGKEPAPFTLVNAQGMLIRGFPRGLDILSVFSFPQADELIKAGHDDLYKGYQEELSKLRKALPDENSQEWQKDLYIGRLNAMRKLSKLPKGIVPKAMKDKHWQLKQLTAALGSWTELRHDTTLYTKQPYAAAQAVFAGMSKAGPTPIPPPPPHGYVEPVPDVYRALKDCFDLLENKIETLGFPEDKALTRALDQFQDTLATLERIATKELAGQIPTDEEYKFIEYVCYRLHLPHFGLPHYRDVSEKFMGATDNSMPVVADVHTDVNSKQVLEEAVGLPMELYIVCPVDNEPTVCIGAIYSYYEFKEPISKRLTDDEWRTMLKEGKQPEQAEWIGSYMVTQSRR
jgi:hypothetical protein